VSSRKTKVRKRMEAWRAEQMKKPGGFLNLVPLAEVRKVLEADCFAHRFRETFMRSDRVVFVGGRRPGVDTVVRYLQTRNEITLIPVGPTGDTYTFKDLRVKIEAPPFAMPRWEFTFDPDRDADPQECST
jgi:hypothetical protein